MNNPFNKKIPLFGIGYGQRGYWGNKHYSTKETVEKGFDAYLRSTHDAYYKSFGEAYTTTEETNNLTWSKSLLRQIKFYNVKKNGKRGVIVHTVQLYAIEPNIAETYLKDPWYSVEDWQTAPALEKV